MNKVWLALLVSSALLACQTQPNYQLIQPSGTFDIAAWTTEELMQPVAIRHLKKTPHSSQHLVRLLGREQPHVHDYHDLTVTVLKGASTIHFRDRAINVKAGDVIHIPSGAYHWAENIGQDACEVLAVFSPGFDGKDKRLVIINGD